MRRRQFIGLLGGAAAWPLTARAQQPKRIARIGFLGIESAAFLRVHRDIDAFRDALGDLGYIEGKNILIEYRYADGDPDRLATLAAELAAQNVDVIVTWATGTFAARQAAPTIPIVQAVGGDLVAMGIAASLAHPGGNITGSTFFIPELMAKRLELLREAVPSISNVGVLLVRDNPATPGILEAMRNTAKALNVALQPIAVGGPGEFDGALSALADQQAGAFVMQDHGYFLSHLDAIATLAARHRLPSIGPLELPASGGMIGYGVQFSDFFRRAAYFVDAIIKGSKPGDIPIEQATKFKTVLNIKTAKGLGLDIPPTLLARADEVIE